MTVLKTIITLLSLGVAASCAYGMSKVDPNLVDSGLSVIDSTQGYMNSVFDQVYGVLGDVSSVNGLLDEVQTILRVDVNVTDISAGITVPPTFFTLAMHAMGDQSQALCLHQCVARSIGSLNPATALSYLDSIRDEIDNKLQPSISALSSDVSTLLGQEVPEFQGYSGTITASPSFLANYSTQVDDFITAVNDLPASFPAGGSTNANVLALGLALTALSLPLNGGATSKSGRIGGLRTALTDLYSVKSADLSTMSDIQSGITALSGVGSNLSITLPALSATLIAAYDNYTAARPCMTSLLTRLQDINSTVVVLPADINDAYSQLQDAQQTLDGVLVNGTDDPTLQATLTSVTDSVSSVPNISNYITALTPAVNAYNALPTSIFTDLENSLTSIDTDILQAISGARDTVNSNIDSFTSKADDLHNKTVDKITTYRSDYEPLVRKYDRYRQAAEYTYFALAIAVCLGIIFAVLTNCQFAASFFTLVLLILTVVYSIIAVIFFLIASIGNDGCTNAEPYIIGRLPDLMGNDPATLNKSIALANYYFYNQGGGVKEILNSVAGVNLDDVFATVNSTRDQAVQEITGTYTLRTKMLSVVDGVYGISNNITKRLTDSESLAAYETIHPLYIKAKTFMCCSGVNMFGNLWVSMFASGSISIILLIFLFIYISALDQLPPRACCGCTMRSHKEFPPLDYKSSQRGDVSETEGLGRAAHVDASAPPMQQEIEGSGLSRGSLLAPNSPKKVSYPGPTPSYTLRAAAAQQSAVSHSQALKQEYMRHALMMDSAGLER
ncbi:hypothetical protein COCSUDRAFT_45025 [Coccomyxa subellipsoidea C-169]|uniref:Plasma membrane fusion protein PRM1 n=1 Tax=Coccomyxa subellipsoidea (strain C-169) TaxID=574566 RepID=I0YKF3_COCSC|nr:hypothetical protein COCSUDRAFT_45025 [Coccomyxa subellipsoidea C-169]EIE18872.1 hypothetical protein COCSUDRAFT_45025 [Coccomyxa subellipsoidea C-169]|eukprot:XP_005643416.1 hypothetical protein COCSUDRAFT_45025 [Coccomyxa subellipsoidea C-169]